MPKELKDKAINIKGKKYVLVSDRVIYFNEEYKNGSITTELISDYDNPIVVVKATVTPDTAKPERYFSDYSQAVVGDGMVNKTAALENASTSAVGRALAYMGIGVIESIASADEMNKAQGSVGGKKATEKQIEWILDEAEKKCGTQDVYEWVEKVLTMKAEDVPVYKVKDAVDLIRKQPNFSYKGSDPVELTDEDSEKIEKGTLLDDVDIPY